MDKNVEWQTKRFYKVIHWLMSWPVPKWYPDPEWMLIEAWSARQAKSKMRAYIIVHPEKFMADVNGFMAWCQRLNQRPNIRMEREYFKMMLSRRKKYPLEIRAQHKITTQPFKNLIRD